MAAIGSGVEGGGTGVQAYPKSLICQTFEQNP